MANVPFHLLKDLDSVRSLFRNLKIGLYTIDKHGEFLDATDEFLEILGLTSIKDLRQSNAREKLNLEPYDRNPAVPRLDAVLHRIRSRPGQRPALPSSILSLGRPALSGTPSVAFLPGALERNAPGVMR